MPTKAPNNVPATYAPKFWSRTTTAPNGCIVWTGTIQSRAGRAAGGYGNCYYGLTHRVAWVLTNGPIPIGSCVLHVCDNPPCVNPVHLRLGTIADNQQDMKEKGRGANRWTYTTHCVNGHLFDKANTRHDAKSGQRVCRTCTRERARQKRARSRG